jgi:hypothetical protein
MRQQGAYCCPAIHTQKSFTAEAQRRRRISEANHRRKTVRTARTGLFGALRRGLVCNDCAALHNPADIVDRDVHIGERVTFDGDDVGEVAGGDGA